MINQILDHRYEILNRVGGGGMAEVYRAHDTLLDRYVAVKVLHAQFANDDEFITKFRREAQGAAKLSHPNIVNIYDVGREENKHYIVMEYVCGETLKDRILREKTIQTEEALRVAREIAEALEHAHQNNLVHCDIKPHNILVTENGRVKVTDFGIARAATSSTMTYSGTVVGSVHYFSPEQAKGAVISTQSDIYSLGVVLYEMLTGRVPFTGETPVGIALKHLQEQPVSVGALNPSVPPIVEAIVLRSMEKEPQNRYGTIAQMITDIKAAEAVLSGDALRHNEADLFATQILPSVHEAELGMRRERNLVEKSNGSMLKSKKLIAGLIAILIMGFLVGAFLSYGEFWSASEVAVPNVVGKQLADAKQAIEQENLRVNVAEAYDAQVPAGQVVSQYPEAGAVVKKQRPVTIYISKGGEAIEAPDLRGISRRDAELKLKNLGLKLGKVDGEASDQSVDTVLNQNPRQGTKVIKGYAIDIVVSKGAEAKKIALPDFKGSSLSTLESQLKSLHLKMGKVTEEVDEKASPGTVLRQSPEAGAQILADTSVDFIVAKEKTAEKSMQVEVNVPAGAEKQAVRIVVTDENGRRIAYENVHKGGDKIVKTLSGTGDLRIQVYINGSIVQEKTI